MQLLFTLGNVALWGASITGFLFCVFYTLTATWWKSEVGWHLMSWSAATEFIFAYLAFASLVRKPGAALPATNLLWIRFVVFAVFWFLIAWRFWMVARAQLSHNPHDPRPPSQIPPIEP